MKVISSALRGYALDLLLGDPAVLTPVHPVVLIGREIRALEQLLRARFSRTKRGELAAGAVMAAAVPVSVYCVSAAALRLLRRTAPAAALVLETVWCWQVLAVKNLRDEALRVQRALERESIEQAREAVSRIVGRDTQSLSREAVACAAVETVAENFSDGVCAPMIYLFLGGAPLALAYKAVNTMDSMVGYRNDRYLWFGRAAARLDDAANYLPARLSALLLIAAAALTGQDGKNALRVWRRDRRAHASPNSGQCEAVAAGALHLRLCGPASYFGVWKQKPYIGDADRSIEPEDIRRVCRMEYVGSGLAALALSGVRMLLYGAK